MRERKEKKRKEKKKAVLKSTQKGFNALHQFICLFRTIPVIAIIKKLEVHRNDCARLNSQSEDTERVKPNRTGLPQDKGGERKTETDKQTDRQTNGRADRQFVCDTTGTRERGGVGVGVGGARFVTLVGGWGRFVTLVWGGWGEVCDTGMGNGVGGWVGGGS